jgi:hypothetical protein
MLTAKSSGESRDEYSKRKQGGNLFPLKFQNYLEHY